MTENVPVKRKKPKHLEQSLMVCEIEKSEDEKKQFNFGVDINLLPEGFKSDKEAIEYVHKKICGTSNSKVAMDTICRTARALPQDGLEEDQYNLVINSCQEMNPKNILEARLCAKETALYTTAMEYLGRAERSLQSEERGSHLWHETYINIAMRLLRIHNETVQTLDKLRRGGEQRVIIQHVNAEQAIVNNGHMEAAGVGGKDKYERDTL